MLRWTTDTDKGDLMRCGKHSAFERNGKIIKVRRGSAMYTIQIRVNGQWTSNAPVLGDPQQPRYDDVLEYLAGECDGSYDGARALDEHGDVVAQVACGKPKHDPACDCSSCEIAMVGSLDD